MARAIVETRMDSKTVRAKLAPRAEPYWRKIRDGGFLGYYRGSRGGRWVARFRATGAAGGYLKTALGEADDTRTSDGSTILTYDQAQDAAKNWFATVQGGRRADKPYTVGEALDDYLANFTKKSLYATTNRVESIIRPEFGSVLVTDLTRTRLTEWHKARGASAKKVRSSPGKPENLRQPMDEDAIRRRQSTANRDLTVLKAALNRAWKLGLVSSDTEWRAVKPFQNVDTPKLRFLNDAEARRLINAMDAAFRPMAQAAMLTGARYGSLIKAKVRDFDQDTGTLFLRDTKGGGDQVVYLEAEGAALFTRAALGKVATAFLFTHPTGRQWKQTEQARYLDAACVAGNVERCTFHDLRRTYGSRLAKAGVPMASIAEALGHADERITRKHYGHIEKSHQAAIIRAHAAGMGIVEIDDALDSGSGHE